MPRFPLYATGFFLASASLFSTLGSASFYMTTALLAVCLFLLHGVVDHFPACKRESHSILWIVVISIILQALFATGAVMGTEGISWIDTLLESYNRSGDSLPLKTLLLNLGMAFPLYAILKKENIPVQRLLFLTATPAIPLAALLFAWDRILMALLFWLHTALLISESQITGTIMAGAAVSLAPWQATALPFLITRHNWKYILSIMIPLAGTAIWNGPHGFSGTPSLSGFTGGHAPVFLLLGAVQVLVWLTVHNPLRSLFIFMGFAALFTPAAAPLLIMMPLAAIYASAPWTFLCAGLLFSSATMGILPDPAPAALPRTLPAYAIFAAILLRKARRTGPPPAIRYKAVKTLSVIIPTLNEEENITHCIRSLYNQRETEKDSSVTHESRDRTGQKVHCDSHAATESGPPEPSLPAHLREIIVADGGSSDRTLSIAESSKTRIINCRKGRGCQIADAMETVSGDAVLILHADCTLEKDATRKIIQTLNKDRSLAGGAFFMAFAPTDSKKSLISFLNNLRAATTGISFGDQGQFARREALTQCSGFPDQMLMEDVELSLRLKNHGRLTLIPGGLTVSGRRWETRGFSSNVTTVIRLFTTYLIQRRFGFNTPDARNYYRTYYKR